MPTTMSIDEVQNKFCGIADFVAQSNSHITILREGRPLVRIMPARPLRRIEPDAMLMGAKIEDRDLFDDCSNLFEAVEDVR